MILSPYFYIKDNLILKNLSIDTEKLDKNSNILKFGITKFIKKKVLRLFQLFQEGMQKIIIIIG